MGTEFEKQPAVPPSSPKSPTSNPAGSGGDTSSQGNRPANNPSIAPRPASPSPGNQQQPGKQAPGQQPQGNQPRSNTAKPALKEASAEVGEGDSESCSASCDDAGHSHDSASPKKGATTLSKDAENTKSESEEAARARANQQGR